MRRKLVAILALIMLATAAALADSQIYYEPGDQVDDFELELTDGSQFALSENEGKIVVMNLWATWCPDCISCGLPALSAVQQAYPDDVAVVAVNCGDTAQDVKDFSEERGCDFPVALDEGLDILYNYFPTNTIPYTAFIDADGRLYATSMDCGEGLDRRYMEIIDEMLAAQ